MILIIIKYIKLFIIFVNKESISFSMTFLRFLWFYGWLKDAFIHFLLIFVIILLIVFLNLTFIFYSLLLYFLNFLIKCKCLLYLNLDRMLMIKYLILVLVLFGFPSRLPNHLIKFIYVLYAPKRYTAIFTLFPKVEQAHF